MRIIYELGNYRIIEQLDEHYDYENLVGDMFNPKYNKDTNPELLAVEEASFIAKVNNLGVFGYTLEVWNPGVGEGWEHVDSCWGYVGAYDPNIDEFNHYIVREMITTIHRQTGTKEEAV